MPNTFRFLLTLCCTVAMHAQTVTATVDTGGSPFSIAVNPVTNKIYVGDQGSNNVTVIDARSP
jgi:DNA-binding beta-propeller fold protein YncE